MKDTTTIKLEKETASILRGLGTMGDTYDSVIKKLIRGDLNGADNRKPT